MNAAPLSQGARSIVARMGRCLLACCVGVGLLAGCARLPVYESQALPPAELQAVREQVRGYASEHCGKCHIASRPTAVPAALKIYNLDAPEWSATLTAAQLRNGFPRRLHPSLDVEGQRRLRAFIEAELALR
jgi:hypothetical protein